MSQCDGIVTGQTISVRLERHTGRLNTRINGYCSSRPVKESKLIVVPETCNA